MLIIILAIIFAIIFVVLFAVNKFQFSYKTERIYLIVFFIFMVFLCWSLILADQELENFLKLNDLNSTINIELESLMYLSLIKDSDTFIQRKYIVKKHIKEYNELIEKINSTKENKIFWLGFSKYKIENYEPFKVNL